MKGNGAAIQGFCAGALMVLTLLAFAVGASGRSRGSAQSSATPVIGVTIVAPASPRLHGRNGYSDATERSGQAVAPVAQAPPAATPALNRTVSATGVPRGEARLATASNVILRCPDVISSTLATPDAGSTCDPEKEPDEAAASGTRQCAIRRSSCAYGLLVGNLDPGITFLGDEAGPRAGEDRLMHPALLRPLAELRRRIERRWPGELSLMVLNAYDSSGVLVDGTARYEREGLYYEGRAVDLRTYPISNSVVGELCWLALESGFDYVRNDGQSCYASVKAPSLCEVCVGAGAVPPRPVAPELPTIVPMSGVTETQATPWPVATVTTVSAVPSVTSPPGNPPPSGPSSPEPAPITPTPMP